MVEVLRMPEPRTVRDDDWPAPGSRCCPCRQVTELALEGWHLDSDLLAAVGSLSRLVSLSMYQSEGVMSKGVCKRPCCACSSLWADVSDSLR